VTGGAVPALSYRTDTAALARLRRTQLGKTILFTDNQDWTDEEIVLGYRAQHQIESAFRDMKNPHFLGWSPMFHWTDSKIRVHALYCVLALTLTSLLQRTLHQKGQDLSLARMLELLGGIQEVLLIYPKAVGEKTPRTATAVKPGFFNSWRKANLRSLNISVRVIELLQTAHHSNRCARPRWPSKTSHLRRTPV